MIMPFELEQRMRPAEAQDLRQQAALGASGIILAVLLVLLAWFVGTKKKNQTAAYGRKLPPGPRGWPIIGALANLTGHRHEALQKLSQKYGPLMFMHLGSIPMLVASNAAMAKEILKTNDRVTASRPRFQVESILSYGFQDIACTSDENYLRNIRRICTMKLFTTSRLNHFQDKRREEVSTMVKSILTKSQDGNPVQMESMFGNLASNLITQMMWNKRHRDSTNNDIFAELSSEFNELMGKNIGDFIPSLNWLSMHVQGLGKRAKSLHKKWDEFLDNILDEHRQKQSRFNGGEETPSDAADLVDVLLNLSTLPEDDADRLSENSVKGILLDMVSAGTDTMAITLQWSLAYLLKNPHMMRKAQDELMATVGTERMVSEEEALNLPYLNAVLKETLRLHPPAPLGLPHWSSADFTVDGFHVPAGSLVLINLWAIQRDPAVWKRPDEFDPERFLNKGALVDWKGQNFELLPFGSGRRMCLGIHLATNVLHLALAQVLHTFDWSLADQQKPEEMDMKQRLGFASWKDIPLCAIGKPRLSNDVIFSQ